MREFRITSRLSPAFGGRAFGDIGTYEKLTGYAVGALDPTRPLNAGIGNIDKAPRNADGLVEYKVDICILQPTDPAKRNGWLFYEIINRGIFRAIARVNKGRVTNRMEDPDDAGNGFLMEQGYTIVGSGWQNDVPDNDDHMQAYYPIARNDDGTPVTGQCLEEIINPSNKARFTYDLHYPAADTNAPASLTVRQQERDPRQTPDGLSWRYIDESKIEIARPPSGTFDAGALFEFIYTAKNPTVYGLAFAGVRDVASFLLHNETDDAGNPNPLAGDRPRHSLLFGISQSGRFIRDFLYQGFNQSLTSGRVFEAAVPLVAGSRKIFLNAAFAQPGRVQRQHEDHSYPGDQFPFAYRELTDPLSEKTDSVLARCVATDTAPKIMHIDSEFEIWQGRGSLVVTDCDGNDIEQPDNVRTYFLPGIPHGQADAANIPAAALPLNPATYAFLVRALLVTLREWVEDGIEPPASAYPSRNGGTLVPADSLQFPAMPGFSFNGQHNGLCLMDHSTVPPSEGLAYPVFVSSIDRYGNSNAGILHPALAAPKATLLGCNFRAPGHGAGALFSTIGGSVPFSADNQERERTGDARPSIAELYPANDAYAAIVERAAESMVAERTLLRADADTIIAAAKRGEDILSAV